MTTEAIQPIFIMPADGALKEYRNRIRDFIRRRVADPDDAEDLVQDVFVQLAVTSGLAEPVEELSAWLFTVARNKIIDWYRKKRATAFSRSGEDEGNIEAGNQPLPDAVVQDLLFNETLAMALDELPDEQREVFVRHEINGESFNEIAASTGVALNTLFSRKRYAVLHLRERLSEYYDEMFT